MTDERAKSEQTDPVKHNQQSLIQAFSKDAIVNKALLDPDKQSKAVKVLVERWKNQTLDWFMLEQQLVAVQEQLNALRVAHQRGFGLICGIESCIKELFEHQDAQTSEKPVRLADAKHS